MSKAQKSNFEFLVDISGIPNRDISGKYQTVIIASTSFNRYNLESIMDNFKTQFPNHWGKKGHKLSKYKLEEIVNFLNRENVRMTTIQFEVSDWEKYKKKYPDEGNLEEKIMGILYFYVLKQIALKWKIYTVLSDTDSSFNIKQSIIICNRLARENNYSFKISFGYLDINPELRFPDWIAAARRKMEITKLKKFNHFKILGNYLTPYYLLKVMKRTIL